MTVTIRDIAQRATVSTATVSRVLNNYPYVDKSTRAAVLKVARELGYGKGRKTSATPQARVVLMLVSGPIPPCGNDTPLGMGEFEHCLWTGAYPVLAGSDVVLRLQHTCQSADEARAYASEAGVAGLILAGGSIDRNFARALREHHLPFVIAGAPLYPMAANCVTAEYLRGTESAVSHLAARGRRRIAFVNGLDLTSSSTEKYGGYRLALAVNSLEYHSEWLRTSDFTSDSGYQHTLSLIQGAPDLDAIVYGSDQQAIGGLHALKASGRRVPDDVAVTGFYDFESSRFADPPLTTVHIDLQQLAAVAARRLAMLLDEPQPDDWLITLPVELIVRGSA